MKIKQFDVFDVYRDGFPTTRFVALFDGFAGEVDCVSFESLRDKFYMSDDNDSAICKMATINIENEIEKVLFNVMNHKE